MDFIQIGCLVPDDLENVEQREWLEGLSDEDNLNFVEVTDGDYSLAREIDMEVIPYTSHKLLEGYITLDPKCYEPDVYANIVKDRDESTSPWSGQKAFRPYEL